MTFYAIYYQFLLFFTVQLKLCLLFNDFITMTQWQFGEKVMIQGVLKKVLESWAKSHFGRNFGQNLCFWANKMLVFGQHIPWVPIYHCEQLSAAALLYSTVS